MTNFLDFLDGNIYAAAAAVIVFLVMVILAWKHRTIGDWAQNYYERKPEEKHEIVLVYTPIDKLQEAELLLLEEEVRKFAVAFTRLFGKESKDISKEEISVLAREVRERVRKILRHQKHLLGVVKHRRNHAKGEALKSLLRIARLYRAQSGPVRGDFTKKDLPMLNDIAHHVQVLAKAHDEPLQKELAFEINEDLAEAASMKTSVKTSGPVLAKGRDLKDPEVIE